MVDDSVANCTGCSIKLRIVASFTTIELEEDGAVRKLHDEDASSEKEGIWKKINTLKHYRVKDGDKVNLALSPELALSSQFLDSGRCITLC